MEQHVLHGRWTLWIDYPGTKRSSGKGWDSNLRKVGTVSTLEEFWGVLNAVAPPSKLPSDCNYYLFREGIEPTWEDKHNEAGGKWVAQHSKQRRDRLDRAWLSSCVAAVSEQLESDQYPNQVCGLVASLRKNQDRVSLWLNAAANESAVMAVGARWKAAMGLRGQTKIGFHPHSDALRQLANTSAGGRQAKYVL